MEICEQFYTLALNHPVFSARQKKILGRLFAEIKRDFERKNNTKLNERGESLPVDIKSNVISVPELSVETSKSGVTSLKLNEAIAAYYNRLAESRKDHICEVPTISSRSFCSCVYEALDSLAVFEKMYFSLRNSFSQDSMEITKLVHSAKCGVHGLQLDSHVHVEYSVQEKINKAARYVSALQNLTAKNICEAHKIIVGIGDSNGGKPAKAATLFQQCVEFVNNHAKSPYANPILHACMAMLIFITTKIFHDGNLRLAKIICNWILKVNNYPWIVFSIADKERLDRSVELANTSPNKNELAKYIIECVIESLIDYSKDLEKLQV